MIIDEAWPSCGRFPQQTQRAMAGTVLTRRAMYELVWSKPMTRVAEDLQISDVALKKMCDRHRVPTPPRGYWAKKQAGLPVTQTRFFETSDRAIDRIEFQGVVAHLVPEMKEILRKERERRSSKKRAPVEVIAVAEPAADVHRVIAPTARTLRKAKPDKDGVVAASGDDLCGITVGSLSIERVIRILDGLALHLGDRGLKLEPIGQKMRVEQAPDKLFLTLTERVDRQKHVPTEAELAEEDRRNRKRERDIRLGRWEYGTYERPYPEYDPVRTGILSVQIENEYVDGLRRTWGDGKIQRLENMAEDIAGGVVLYLAGLKAKRKERVRRERQWARERQLREFAAARVQRETKRHEFVHGHSQLVGELAELKALLTAVDDRRRAGPLADFDRMISWVKERVERLEARLHPSGIDKALKDNKLFSLPDPLIDPLFEEEDDDE